MLDPKSVIKVINTTPKAEGIELITKVVTVAAEAAPSQERNTILEIV